MQIRKITKNDIPFIEDICIKTANSNLVNSAAKKQTALLLYNKYYTRAETDSCFVLTDDRNIPKGYILCSKNYFDFKKSFYKNELKRLARISPYAFFSGIGCVSINKPFAKNYPAHMHIDILPEFQAKGFGSKLLQALTDHLKLNNINGLMLAVDSANNNAVKFYKKNGFIELKHLGNTIIMGVKL